MAVLGLNSVYFFVRECFLLTNCYSKRVGFCQHGQIVFFFSSNTVLFNISLKTVDSCFKGSLLFFHSSNLFKLKFLFEAFLQLNCWISFFLQCYNVSGISHVPINSFSTSHWFTEFQRWALKNRRHNHK